MATEMQNGVPKQKLSARKQAGEIITRVTEMEEALPQIINAVNRGIGTLQNQLSHNVEIVDALVAILGEETVNAQIEQNRRDRAIAEGEARKQAVVQAQETGRLVAEETIRAAVPAPNANNLQPQDPARWTDVGSFVSTIEFDANGDELPGSYRCLSLAGIQKEFSAALEGKQVGFEMPVPLRDGNQKPILDAAGKPVIGLIRVVGIYKRMPPSDSPATVRKESAPPAAPAEMPTAPTTEGVVPAATPAVEG